MPRLSRQLPPISTPEQHAYHVVDVLRRAGHVAYTVGGSVRDRLLARPVTEVDVATNATPAQVQALFPHTVAVGAKFGVIVVVIDQTNIEVATFREDVGYFDGRHPSKVCFTTAEEDARRRDFTINALFYDPKAGEVIDHTGGLADLERGLVRAIGKPGDRFAEDHLRMLRAVRFTVRFGFSLDPATEEAIRTHAADIVHIAPERIFAELTKMLVGPRPHQAVALLESTGLLQHILPELTAMKGVAQPAQWHPEGDVWVHNLLLQELMVAPTPEIAWGCLLHDVGKPPTFALSDRGIETFPCHAEVGAEIAREILQRLRCSNHFIDDVVALVGNHMTFKDVPDMRRATLRRLIARPTFQAELELHRIDCLASSGRLDNYVFLLDQLHAIANEPAVPPPLLTGRDLMALGIPEGPAIGNWLRQLQERQLEGELTTPDDARAWLQQQLAAPGA